MQTAITRSMNADVTVRWKLGLSNMSAVHIGSIAIYWFAPVRSDPKHPVTTRSSRPFLKLGVLAWPRPVCRNLTAEVLLAIKAKPAGERRRGLHYKETKLMR